jgi:hypothetical protein
MAKMSSKPLQALSPERVNGTRPLSTSSVGSMHKPTTTTSGGSISKAAEYDLAATAAEDIPSPFASPLRHKAANLFADYNPHRHPPNKESGFTLGGSPSLGDIHALKAAAAHVRGTTAQHSDVQGLVKRFEHLDVRDRDAESAEKRKKLEAELRRAQIAREEAEGDARKLREEVRRQKKEIEEGRERERKVGKRLEVVMVSSVNSVVSFFFSGVSSRVWRAHKHSFLTAFVLRTGGVRQLERQQHQPDGTV